MNDDLSDELKEFILRYYFPKRTLRSLKHYVTVSMEMSAKYGEGLFLPEATSILQEIFKDIEMQVVDPARQEPLELFADPDDETAWQLEVVDRNQGICYALLMCYSCPVATIIWAYQEKEKRNLPYDELPVVVQEALMRLEPPIKALLAQFGYGYVPYNSPALQQVVHIKRKITLLDRIIQRVFGSDSEYPLWRVWAYFFTCNFWNECLYESDFYCNKTKEGRSITFEVDT